MHTSYYTDGDFLYIQDGAELPAKCVVKNIPIGAGGWRRRIRVIWTPWRAWITFPILFFTLPFFSEQQKTAYITYSLSKEIASGLAKQKITGVLILFIGFSLIIYGLLSIDNELHLKCGLLCGFASILISIFYIKKAKIISVTGYSNGWFKLKGLSPEFLTNTPRKVNL